MKPHNLPVISPTANVLSAIHEGLSTTAVARNNDWMLLLALTPPILAAFAASEIGSWVVHEIARQVRIREKRPASPSLRGTPTPEEILDDWSNQPRSLSTCLRLGSRLADLDPTLDHTLLRTTLPNGKTLICARKGGMKGWLADHRVRVTYSTVMRYKKLAQRLRQVLSLDDRIPLEWLLPADIAAHPVPADLAASFTAARHRLAKLLRGNPTLKSLSRAAEKSLGIIRLVAVRKAQVRRRLLTKKQRKHPCFSVISQGRSATASPERAEATKNAMLRVLRARDPAGSLLLLQNRIRHWLAGIGAKPAP